MICAAYVNNKPDLNPRHHFAGYILLQYKIPRSCNIILLLQCVLILCPTRNDTRYSNISLDVIRF